MFVDHGAKCSARIYSKRIYKNQCNLRKDFCALTTKATCLPSPDWTNRQYIHSLALLVNANPIVRFCINASKTNSRVFGQQIILSFIPL